jgi:hypothetical protein
MNRELIQKLIGGALVLSGVVLLVLKVLSISEARESWAAWASPEGGMIWFIGALVLELVFLLARFILGYLVFLNGRIKPWLFYPLAAITALSGLSGAALVLAALALRWWRGGSYAAKT